jgi:hypothetical protein
VAVIRRARPAVMAVKCMMAVGERYSEDSLKVLMIEVVLCVGAMVEIDRLGVIDTLFIENIMTVSDVVALDFR